MKNLATVQFLESLALPTLWTALIFLGASTVLGMIVEIRLRQLVQEGRLDPSFQPPGWAYSWNKLVHLVETDPKALPRWTAATLRWSKRCMLVGYPAALIFFVLMLGGHTS